MEASFALLESTVPEYDRLGIVRGPQGTNLKGIAPSNIFKSSDDKWIVIAANADNVFRRLCDAMRQARARRRPEVRDAPRSRRQPGRDRGDRRRLGARAHGEGDRRDAERGGRHLRPDLHDRRHLRGPAVPGEGHAPHATSTRSSASTSAPGSCPSCRAPPVPCAGRPRWEEGSHNEEVYGDLLGLERRGARSPARGGRAVTAVTICDVAPRDGLQNDSAVLDPVTRAELVNRLARRGSAPHRGRELRPSRLECRRWRAPRRWWPGIERLEGVTYAGLALNERGYERLRETDARRGALRLRRQRRVQPAERGHRHGGLGRGGRADRGPRARGRPAGHRHARHRVRLPVRGRRRPGRVLALAARFVDAGADEIVFADTVGVGGTSPGTRTSSPRGSGSARPSACTCTTRATPAWPTRWPPSTPGRRCSTRPSVESAAAPSRHARPGTSAPRTSCTSSTARASRPASTSARSIEVAQWLEGVLGRELEGMVYRAGVFAPVAG